MTVVKSFSVLLSMALVIGLSGCQPDANSQTGSLAPVEIAENDLCHVCGMVVEDFSGPKGQISPTDMESAHHFCSTRELFSFLLQPENKHLSERAFVHNMADANWMHPEDDTFIVARDAWYVIQSSRTGAMGPTLASFAKQTEAERFIGEYGGVLKRFDELDLATLVAMGDDKIAHEEAMHGDMGHASDMDR